MKRYLYMLLGLWFMSCTDAPPKPKSSQQNVILMPQDSLQSAQVALDTHLSKLDSITPVNQKTKYPTKPITEPKSKPKSTPESDEVKTKLESGTDNSRPAQHKTGPISKEKPMVTKVVEDSIKVTNPKTLEHVKEDTSKEQVTTSVDRHRVFDQLLMKFVSEAGEVNYSGLKSKELDLERYIKELSLLDPKVMSPNAQMAFWTNLYNAATLHLVVQNHPIQSILDLDGGKTWDVKRIQMGEQLLSLNQIEHDILRPEFMDARVHFVLNCAAKSCPPLYHRAYTELNIQRLLDQQTRFFIRDSTYNKVKKESVSLSKIFEWYRDDFGVDLINFVNKNSATKASSNAKIKFRTYDWTLNGH